ncbi:zinc ribbon domain-containing protein [Virgibacillus salinus]|uniref:Double zinc ribbon n=1 Tax=Virgibacillus salinus TaxID=553311 RepID=A0A1H0ZBC4_9BACI|nr:zinc ribbon domain-containing protein [Virgibacillus salinus]SDQ24649.1 Double zinc ribbon [Virgibacillus salinus]
MYCSECGTKNDPHALYCVEDGYPLQTQVSRSLRVNINSYCGLCGTANNHIARYCAECGSSFETYKESKHYSRSHTYFDIDLGKKVLPGFLLSIGILFLIIIIMASVKGSGLIDLFMKVFIPLNEEVLDKLSILDFALITNLSSFLIGIGDAEFSQQLAFSSTGLVYLALIPAISLIAGGLYSKYRNPIIEEWKAAVFFAIGYGGLLGTISIITGDKTLESEFYIFNIDYYFISALINGLFIGFFFSYVGMLIFKGPLKEKLQLISYQRALYYSSLAFVGVIIIAVIISVFQFTQYTSVISEKRMFQDVVGDSIYADISFVGKIAVYLLNLAMFNTFIFQGTHVEAVEYSFYAGISNTVNENMGGLIDFIIPVKMFESYEFISVIIVAIFFIIVGRLITKSQKHYINTIVMYSIFFAFIVSFFTYHLSINYSIQHEEVNNPQGFFAGFKLIQTFFISLLYAGLTGFIGAYSRKLF